ncbi:MAG: hypothetical protein IJZ42_09430 [Lachnospiraceae bacterium]|nr:hypothetical protein [Lachnospiraceae bacterium]
MRIFVVNGEYDKADVYAALRMNEQQAELTECINLEQAVSECQNPTEDKISIIIFNTNKIKEKVQTVLQVQTFGNFEVFYKGKPVAFNRAKSKELLAYLIDRRGSTVTTSEASSVLWEDREYNNSRQRQFQTIVSDLFKSLKKYKCEHIICRKRNCLSVDVTAVECDFYALLAGDRNAFAQYNGEYMSNYSWAEMTAGYLSQKYSMVQTDHK